MKQINIMGDIIASEADRWFASEVTPEGIIAALNEANGEAVEILINSNGGSVAAGIAIANAIKRYPGETTCVVLGLAASMASVVACAGKTLKMGEGAFLMIHNPWTYTSGNAEELRKDADTLDKMRDSILGFYLGKCPDKEEELKAAMDAETWLSRDEAKAMGFAVTDYEGEFRAAASLTRRAIGKAPESIKGLFEVRADKPAAEAPEKPSEAAAEVTATDAQPEAEKPAEAQETASDAKPAEEAKNEKPAENWEARFKGLSAKYNAAKAEHEQVLAARDEEIKQLKCQMEKQTQALADATAKVSELAAQVEEKANALQTATDDLAKARDSQKLAEDKAKQLEDTRDMLTAGVLTPPTASSYADKMKAAKTPEEREALRAQKRAGKIN